MCRLSSQFLTTTISRWTFALTFVVLFAVLIVTPSPALAASASAHLTAVTTTSCTPGDVLKVTGSTTYNVVSGESILITLTIKNLRTNTSTSHSPNPFVWSSAVTYPYIGYIVNGAIGTVPSGTIADDTLQLSAVFKDNNGTLLDSVTYQFNCSGGPLVSVSSTKPQVVLFSDGRVNNDEAAETSAIYCLENGSIRVYVPSSPLWVVSFTATAKEIAAVPTHPAQNTLIKQGWHARLYRLTTGELQVNSPSSDPAKGDYSFIFNGCES